MSLTTAAAKVAEHGELPLHPYAIGGIALGILLAALLALLVFGAGREHS